MPRLMVRACLLTTAVACVLTVLPSVASANETGGTGTGGDHKGPVIDATVYAVSYEPAAVGPGHPLKAVTGWTPPPCWQAPVANPAELKAEREANWGLDSTGYEWDAKQRDYYVDGNPHTDFEVANTGKGMWWNGQANPNRLAETASLSCFHELDDWVLNGDKPPGNNGPVVTPEILAQSAYDRVRIQDKIVTLSPDAQHPQTVNLKTWAWLDSADIPPVSVTARLASLGIWATTTAEPVGLQLRAGTPDATLYPTSGYCPINKDGSIGKKYQPGDGNAVTPPCGLTYQRSSGKGTFSLTAAITWQVSWVGSGGTGGPLDNGVFETQQPLTVREVQSVNR